MLKGPPAKTNNNLDSVRTIEFINMVPRSDATPWYTGPVSLELKKKYVGADALGTKPVWPM